MELSLLHCIALLLTLTLRWLFEQAPNDLCAYLTLDGVVEALSGLFPLQAVAVFTRAHEKFLVARAGCARCRPLRSLIPSNASC